MNKAFNLLIDCIGNPYMVIYAVLVGLFSTWIYSIIRQRNTEMRKYRDNLVAKLKLEATDICDTLKNHQDILSDLYAKDKVIHDKYDVIRFLIREYTSKVSILSKLYSKEYIDTIYFETRKILNHLKTAVDDTIQFSDMITSGDIEITPIEYGDVKESI